MLLDHLGGLEHRPQPGPVGVEREHDARSQAPQLGDLLVSERRAHQPDAIGDAGLVCRDHVEVALAEHRGPRASRLGAREVRREQPTALVVDLAVGAVEVLARILGVERAGTEAEDLAAGVTQREGDPPAETRVAALAGVARATHEPGRQQLRVGEALAPRGGEHALRAPGREADAELAQRRLLQSTAGQVLARRHALLGVPQHALVVAARSPQQLEEAVAAPAAIGLARVLLGALQRDVVAVGEILDRADEVSALGLLDEGDRVALRLAAEAVVQLVRWLDAERRRALVMKRAAPGVGVRADTAQLGARADEVQHVDRVLDGPDRVLGVARHQRANARGTASSSYARMQ